MFSHNLGIDTFYDLSYNTPINKTKDPAQTGHPTGSFITKLHTRCKMLRSNLAPNSTPVNPLHLAQLHDWLTLNFGDACATIEYKGETVDGPFISTVGLDDACAGQYFFEYDELVNGRVITRAAAHTATGLARAILESEAVVSFVCYAHNPAGEPTTVGTLTNGTAYHTDELDELFTRQPVRTVELASVELPY